MDFVNLGAHCSVKTCRQQDFLPFECEQCRQKFCKKHRTQRDHSCPYPPRENYVIKCPMCDVGITLYPNIDPNVIWDRHFTSGNCVKKQGIKCPVTNCKTILTEINSCVCNSCNQRICLSHRYFDQHQCKNQSNKNKSSCILF